MSIKFASRVAEKTSDGITTTIVWTGSRKDMESMSASQAINSATAEGKLKSSRVYQESPLIWCCERKYSTSSDGDYTQEPENEYGKKSAQLKGSMLSIPLECHKNYKTCWNYFLAAAKGTGAVPSWWETAKDAVLSMEDSQVYAWIKTPGELPVDKTGRWHVLKDPLKPGQDTYDMATYSVTETARFRSARAAGKMVANTLNRIGSPEESFGIKDGNWKCDDASVSYNGKDWLATMTWTLSGNSTGWDKELYTEK